MRFSIRPHPKAPLLSSRPQDADLIIQQLLGELRTPNQEAVELLREAGFVNLWFFLKVIAGYSGPYADINDGLHLEMCNFRQSDYCMEPGARWACFIPRLHFKSTIMTHGPSAWLLLRDTERRMVIFNAIADIAAGLAHTAQRTFDRNDFFGLLYPEYVPGPSSPRWNENEFVLPNRQRNFNEPSLIGRGIGAAAESLHFTDITVDDPAGMEDLDVDHRANINMKRAINWANTNLNTLIDDAKTSIIGWVGTRYAIDDVHTVPLSNARRVLGCQDGTIKVREDGQWTVYYRKAVEDGEVIFPERFTKEFFDRMKQNDYWTYITQFQNEPQTAGMVEFYSYPTGRCRISFEKEGWTVFREAEEKGILISSVSCVCAVDPAGTEKGMNAKTSRTAIRVWVMDAHENVYLIHSKLGYFSVEEMFNLIFEANKRFKGCIQTTLIESNAMQKIIRPLLWKEEATRKEFINPQPVMAKGDKVARIRNTLGWFLSHQKVFLTEETAGDFIDEKNQFPMGSKMDGLDADEKALTWMRRPATEQEVEEHDRFEEEYVLQSDNNFGY